MMGMDDFNEGKYDEDILDIDEVVGSDIKINPDFYIHKALLKAQDALAKDNLKDGWAQFRVIVEHIEILCRAAGMIDKDYEKRVSEYKASPEYTEDDLSYSRSVKLGNKKIEFLMGLVFNQKTSTDPLKA